MRPFPALVVACLLSTSRVLASPFGAAGEEGVGAEEVTVVTGPHDSNDNEGDQSSQGNPRPRPPPPPPTNTSWTQCSDTQVAILEELRHTASYLIALALTVDMSNGSNTTSSLTGSSIWDSYFLGANSTTVTREFLSMLTTPQSADCYVTNEPCDGRDSYASNIPPRNYLDGKFCPWFFNKSSAVAPSNASCEIPTADWIPNTAEQLVLLWLAETVTGTEFEEIRYTLFQLPMDGTENPALVITAMQELWARKSYHCTGVHPVARSLQDVFTSYKWPGEVPQL